jgi:hypothetical protein
MRKSVNPFVWLLRYGLKTKGFEEKWKGRWEAADSVFTGTFLDNLAFSRRLFDAFSSLLKAQ